MAVTSLNLVPGKREIDWTINASESDASAGVVLKAAQTNYKHGIKKLIITPNEANKWFQILDGASVMIGPVGMPQNVPYIATFISPIYASAGNAISVKTETAYWIHLLIEGTTGEV